MRVLAVCGGWFLAATIVWLSLAPDVPSTGFALGDKVQHFLAYGALTLWFWLLYPRPRARLAYALLWIAMGVALEFAQGATGYRTFDLADMAANTLGVLVGAVAALSLPRGAAAAGRERP